LIPNTIQVEALIMRVGVRFFVVKSDDTFERWSQARFNRVWEGDEPVLEFAGRRLRCAVVFVETKGRKAVNVRGVEWNVLAMDITGRHDRMSALRDAVDVVSAATSPYPSPIADARRKFYDRKAHWEPTPALRAAILDAALNVSAR
jgi:hypothetical protein